jgi:uncharacterized protein YodC (DUF2158 family)
MSNEFKVGDKVRLTADRKSKHPEALHGRLTVDSLLGMHIGVSTEDGKFAGFFPRELEADGFRVGDRVVSPQYSHSKVWGGTLIVSDTWSDGGVSCFCEGEDERSSGYFEATELKHAPASPAPVAIEQEPEPQPVTYRICVGSTIGKTEYPSLETAKAAALLHGKDGEEFSIWEVVKVADFRVKVTKSLETVEAA